MGGIKEMIKNKKLLYLTIILTLSIGVIFPTYDAAQMVKMIDREKVIVAEVMSREEACVEMEYTDHDFYVFRDSDRNDTLSILYKRKEKGYGLLVVDEPF